MDWQTALILFGGVMALIAGIARRFGLSRRLAFAIPVTPWVLWTIYCLVTGAAAVGEGGGVPLVVMAAPMAVAAAIAAGITVWLVEPRKK